MIKIIRKAFTYLIVLFPLLSIYYSNISTLTIADILLFLILPLLLFYLFKNKVSIKISMFFLIVIFYMILQMLIYCVLGKMNNAAIFTTLRLILYYFTMCFFFKNFFDFQEGYKLYKKVAIISSLYFLFQFILLNLFDIFIPGTIPFFKSATDNYNSIMASHSWTSSAYARPRSFFTEPSHFAIYVGLCLAIMLLKKDKKDIKYIIIITVAMLLSGSGMAIILTIISYGLFLIKNIKKISKKVILITIIGIIICIPILNVYLKSESFNIFYTRTFVEKDSTEGRFGNFTLAFTSKKDTISTIFGEGAYKIADVEGQNYITSIPRVYTYFGILGMLFFVISMIYYLIKLKEINKLSLIVLLAISFAGEILFHNLLFTYTPYILCKESRKKYE